MTLRRTLLPGIAAALLAGSSLAVAAPDPEATFLTTPNFPLRDPLPVVANATPGDGLAMAPGSRNAFSLVMGSNQRGANMTTSQSIRDRFFLNYSTGDLNKAIGSPIDNGQSNNNTFAAVARHFPMGDPNDLHVMAPDGMHLRAICSERRTNCRPGNVWAAMVRLPFEWRPGTTLKIRYRSPKGEHSWAPIWMFTGQQISPGPGGNPYQGFGTPNALYRASSGKNFEIDWNDNFPRVPAGCGRATRLISAPPTSTAPNGPPSRTPSTGQTAMAGATTTIPTAPSSCGRRSTGRKASTTWSAIGAAMAAT